MDALPIIILITLVVFGTCLFVAGMFDSTEYDDGTS